jgi:hypothetical protein
MATVQSVMSELKSRGSEKTQITYARHGMPKERTLGVSVADLKVVAKGIKGQQKLALELYATGMMEAMYLAGMVAKGDQMTRTELQSWAEGTFGMSMIAEHTVPWVAVESKDGPRLALGWMDSDDAGVATAGWSTWSGLMATRPDAALDLPEVERLLGCVVGGIGGAKNRVKYTMNGFVISVGTYVAPLHARAKAVAAELGAVAVDVGDTACEVPLAAKSIEKVEAMGRVGQKRKTIRC